MGRPLQHHARQARPGLHWPRWLRVALRQVAVLALLWTMHDSRHRQRQIERHVAADREALHRMRVQELHDMARVAALRADIDAIKRWGRR